MTTHRRDPLVLGCLGLAALALLLQPVLAGETIDLAVSAPDATIHARGFSILGSFGDRLSAPAAPADISGDGRPDLLTSAWMADGQDPASPRIDSGEVHVLFGPLPLGGVRDLRTDPADVTIFGARERDSLHAQWGGDLDGDGQPDLLLNAPEDDGAGGSRANAGAVFVLCGPFASGTVIDMLTATPDIVVRGARAGDELNARDPVDIDGDGDMDMLLVAARGDGPGGMRPDAGEAFVLSGPFARGSSIDLATAIPAIRIVGADSLDTMSWAKGGDFNGDGLVDLALGVARSSGWADGNPLAGEVHVLFAPLGAAGDLATDSDFIAYGDANDDSLGGLLAAGDLNGDGASDLVMGACCTDADGGARPYSGSVHVFFSPLPADTRFASEADIIVVGANPYDTLRYAVAGRVNGDACDDLVVGADYGSGPGGLRPESGEISVLDGPFTRFQRIDLAAGSADLTVRGANGAGVGDFGDFLAIASIGDVTGDGQDDLIASAQFADGPAEARRDSGEIYILQGGCAHLPAAPTIVNPSLDTLHCVWPPNHRLACFSLADFHPVVETTCGVGGSFRLSDCSSDQDESLRGGGADRDGEPDCAVSADGTSVCVRAERAGGGPGAEDGRRYVISAIPVDACGIEGAPVIIGTIHVPHDGPPRGACRAGT